MLLCIITIMYDYQYGNFFIITPKQVNCRAKTIIMQGLKDYVSPNETYNDSLKKIGHCKIKAKIYIYPNINIGEISIT